MIHRAILAGAILAVWVVAAVGQTSTPPGRQAAKDNVAELIARLKDSDLNENAVAEAAFALGRSHSDAAVQPLVEALRERKGIIRLRAAGALSEIGSSTALDALAKVAQDPDSDIRREVAGAFCTGQRSPAFVGNLIEMLGDKNPEVVLNVLRALAYIQDARAAEPIVGMLTRKDNGWGPEAKIKALNALGAMKDKKAVETVAKFLQDKDANVRRAAEVALAALEGKPRPPIHDEGLIRDALKLKIEPVNFSAVHLGDVLNFMRGYSQCQFEADWKAIADAGVKVDVQTPITVSARRISVVTFLNMVLDSAAGPGALDFTVRGGKVLILPAEQVRRELVGPIEEDVRRLKGRANEVVSPVKGAAGPAAFRQQAIPLLEEIDRKILSCETMRWGLATYRVLGVTGSSPGRLITERTTREKIDEFLRSNATCTALAGQIVSLTELIRSITAAGDAEAAPLVPKTPRVLYQLNPANKVGRFAEEQKATSLEEYLGLKFFQGMLVLDKDQLRGKALPETYFDVSAESCGDVEFQGRLTLKVAPGGKADWVGQVFLDFGPPGTDLIYPRDYYCTVSMLDSPARMRVLSVGHEDKDAGRKLLDWLKLRVASGRFLYGPYGPDWLEGPFDCRNRMVILFASALTDGQPHLWRMTICGGKMTVSLGGRSATVDCDPLPPGARLKYLTLSFASRNGSVVTTLEGVKVVALDAAPASASSPGTGPAASPELPASRPTAEQEAQAAGRLQMAEAMVKAGRKEKAIEYYEKIIKDFPGTNAAKDAQYALQPLRRRE
jgi:SOS response regulatory protein OraA/RecX